MFKEKLHEMAFEVGDTVILRCVVAGQPTPTCVWYKNEELLSDGNRLKVALYYHVVILLLFFIFFFFIIHSWSFLQFLIFHVLLLSLLFFF